MPQLARHIDDIAAFKQRDVLFIRKDDLFPNADWFNGKPCQAITAWLDEHDIAWEYCAPPRAASGMTSPCLLYIDLPFDTDSAMYQQLTSFLGEKADGSLRWKKLFFCLMPLVA